MAMHPWLSIFILATCCFAISYATDPDYFADEGEAHLNPSPVFTSGFLERIFPDCKLDVEQMPLLKGLRETHGLCLFILVLSKMPYIGEDGFYTPTPADQHFPLFWKYHGDRCINYEEHSQATFYNFGDNFPSDILFTCVKPTHDSGVDRYSLVTHMLADYIVASDSRPYSNKHLQESETHCIDGNSDNRLLITGSRTCMIAVLMDSVVLGHTVFNPFQIEEGSSTKLADYGSSFLEIQANYKGCAPQWARLNFVSNYEDDFIPDGHCNGAMGKTKFDILCCCYKKRRECAFMPPHTDKPITQLTRKVLSPLTGEDLSPKRNERSVLPAKTQMITCAIGRFDEKTNSMRRQGPVKEFLSNDTAYCALTFEYRLRDDLLTYDLTYVMDRGTDKLCVGKSLNKPFVTAGGALSPEYNIRDTVSISVCCNYTLCNNIAGGFKTDGLVDMPTIWSPKIGREIRFHCGYPHWDVLRYLSKDKAVVCPFMISADKNEYFAGGLDYASFNVSEVYLRRNFKLGWCAYFPHSPTLLYGCIINQALALTYKPKEEWLQQNYNHVQRILRQIKHVNDPMPECRSTNGNMVPLIDFVRGNYTEPRIAVSLCFVYIVYDDFGGTMIKAGPCNFNIYCCYDKPNVNSYRIEPCANGFCAQSEYEAVCHPYDAENVPNLGEMIEMLKFGENTTDIIVAQSDSTQFSKSKKLRVPYYCMFGVLSLCKNKEWHAIHDARTCLTVPVDTYDAQNRNGIRKTTVAHPRHDSKEIHTYYLTCALDREGKITKTLSADFKFDELSAAPTKTHFLGKPKGSLNFKISKSFVFD